MITPIIMLTLMTAPYLLVEGMNTYGPRAFDVRAAANVGLGLLFSFTALGHFVQTDAMAAMLPAWVPQRVLLVYLTGVLELAIAAAFLCRRTRRYAGWAAAAVLVLFFPANVYAAMNHVPMGGHAWGPAYLWIRAPLQLAILFWVIRFALLPERAPLAGDGARKRSV